MGRGSRSQAVKREDLDSRLLSTSAPEVMKHVGHTKRSASMLTHNTTPDRASRVPV